MKTVKIIGLSVVILIFGYFSIEITPLDAFKKETESFDATGFAQNYLNNVLPEAYKDAVLISKLSSGLKNDKEATFDAWSHAIAVGNIGHFLVQFSGTVTAINEDEVHLDTTDGLTIILQTEFVYGNSIRDAAGLVDNKAFPNTSDLNAIAAEINKIIREDRIPSFRQNLKVGDVVEGIGVLELNRKFSTVNEFEILPIQTKVL